MEKRVKRTIEYRMVIESHILDEPDYEELNTVVDEHERRYLETKFRLLDAIKKQPGLMEKLIMHLNCFVAQDEFFWLFFRGGSHEAKEIITPALEALSKYDQAFLMEERRESVDGYDTNLPEILHEIFTEVEPMRVDFDYQMK